MFDSICRMSSYFPFISNILCGLCSHSSSRAAKILQRLLRGPLWPPAGRDLDWDNAFGHASKCFYWWARNMLDAVPERGSSQTQPEPKLNQAWSHGERCGFCWQENVSCCESDSAVAVWAWIIEGLVMMMMMMMVAKRLCLPLPLLAVDRHNRCFHSVHVIFSGNDCDDNKAVTSPLQLDKLVLITLIQHIQDLYEPPLPVCSLHWHESNLI